MKIEEFVKQLNVDEYPFVLTGEQREICKANNWLVVYGYSDDIVEYDGLFHDETYADNGKTDIPFDKSGLIQRPDFERYEFELDEYDIEFEKYLERKKNALKIDALWCPDSSCSWEIQTKVKHHKFNIMEDGEIFCKAIVIDFNDLEVQDEPENA